MIGAITNLPGESCRYVQANGWHTAVSHVIEKRRFVFHDARFNFDNQQLLDGDLGAAAFGLQGQCRVAVGKNYTLTPVLTVGVPEIA